MCNKFKNITYTKISISLCTKHILPVECMIKGENTQPENDWMNDWVVSQSVVEWKKNHKAIERMNEWMNEEWQTFYYNDFFQKIFNVI